MRRFLPAGALFLLVALGLSTATVPAGAVTATPEEKAAAVVRPSIVYVEMHWSAYVRVPRSSRLFYVGYVNRGRPFTWGTRCSGFVVNPDGYIVTAGHCVDEGEEGARGTALTLAVQWLIDNGWAYRRDLNYWLLEAHATWGVEGQERGSPPDLSVYVQRGVAAGGLKTGEAFPARVVDYESFQEGDVALLKIEQTGLPTVQIAPSEDIEIGTDVLSVGYPGSSDEVTDATYEPTYKDGSINSKKTREGGLLPVYEMSAALSGGMSGGPTVNLDGQVVGVNSFNISGETEAFNFITPSSLVSEMLARNGVTNELGPVDQAYRDGLAAYFSGDYRTALKKFDEVLALSPTHQQAQEFKVKAAQEAAKAPKPAAPADTGGGFPLWVIGVVVGGVLIVALAVVVTRRRKPAPAPAVAAPAPAPAVVAEAAPMNPVGFRPEPSGNGGAAVPAAQAAPAAPMAPMAPKAVATAEDAPRFCENCGTGLQLGARFCPSCGHPVGA